MSGNVGPLSSTTTRNAAPVDLVPVTRDNGRRDIASNGYLHHVQTRLSRYSKIRDTYHHPRDSEMRGDYVSSRHSFTELSSLWARHDSSSALSTCHDWPGPPRYPPHPAIGGVVSVRAGVDHLLNGHHPLAAGLKIQITQP